METYGGLAADQNWHFTEQAGLTNSKDRAAQAVVELKMYPNPAYGPVHVQLNLPAYVDQCRLSLYNTYGQLVDRIDAYAVPAGVFSTVLTPNPYGPTGICFLEVVSDGRSQTKKLFFSGPAWR